MRNLIIGNALMFVTALPVLAQEAAPLGNPNGPPPGDAKSAPHAAPHDSGADAPIEAGSSITAPIADPLRADGKDALAGSAGVLTVTDGVKLWFAGYADAGYYAPQGDGPAYVRDIGHQAFPKETAPWVFSGDPWANMINSNGDSADLGLDRSVIHRYDPIASRGHGSFIVNNVNLTMFTSAPYGLLFEMSMNLEPRSGHLGSWGDTVNVDLAFADWTPFKDYDLHIYGGKMESAFGREYRNRKAPDRFGITPSLIARYTTGNPTGVKIRGSILDKLITLNLALTNGGTSSERFGHFFGDTDTNDDKTLSGRLSVTHSFGAVSFDLGGSFVYGAQDGQPSNKCRARQLGADLRVDLGPVTLQGEYVDVHDDGGGVANAPFLSSRGWYAEAYYQAVPFLGVVVRVDQRDARMLTLPDLYLSDVLRVTGGLRADITYNIIVKAEYLHIIELKGPELRDDILTTSAIWRF